MAFGQIATAFTAVVALRRQPFYNNAVQTPIQIGGVVNADTIELLQIRLGKPGVIGRTRQGEDFWSSIHRQPTPASELYLTPTGFDEDRPTQTRPKKPGDTEPLHGGTNKAVLAYPSEHYKPWTAELGEAGMGGRSFGENLSLAGVTEDGVHMGDVWQWGEATLEVSRVRGPCYTLDVYYGRKMTQLMTANGRCGWYLRVVCPGVVPTRGTIQVVHRNTSAPTVAQAFQAKMQKG
jgi:MOSC domain-containing protein YiiM